MAFNNVGGVLLSSEGKTWTSNSLPAASFPRRLVNATSGNGNLVAVGNRSYTQALMYTSQDDGQTWSEIPLNLTNQLTAITYCNGRFVAVGYNGLILESTDTVSWQQSVAPVDSILSGIACDANKFVAVGYNGTILTKAHEPSFEPNLTLLVLNDGFLKLSVSGGMTNSVHFEESMDLQAWSPLQTAPSSSVRIAPAQQRRFYRARFE